MVNELKTEKDEKESVKYASKFILGCPVLLKDKSNNSYHGIFNRFTPELNVLLDCCHKIEPEKEVLIFGKSLPRVEKVDSKLFERENIVEMTAFEVDIDYANKSAENMFIDSSIAKKIDKQKYFSKSSLNSDDDLKELEPFLFDEECLSSDTSTRIKSLDLDDSSNFGWNAEDMLLTNQTKYGYKSTYNSDLTEYTLPVEKEDTEEYRKREEEAEKLALEIESSSTYRKNIDKELTDNEEEEEAFSAVIRTNNQCPEINNNSMHNRNLNYSNDSKEFKFSKRRFKKSNPNNNPKIGRAKKINNNYFQTV